jgi:phosphohistidine phosphatase
MPRMLWLLRHGDAEPHGAAPDFERQLTARGAREAQAAGRLLALLGVKPDLVFTSPRVRARDTAAIACKAMDVTPVVHEPLSDQFGAGEARELLAAAGGDDTLLLVGHEPDLSELVRAFSGARIELKKGGIAAMRVHDGRLAELLTLLRPREIELLGGGRKHG